MTPKIKIACAIILVFVGAVFVLSTRSLAQTHETLFDVYQREISSNFDLDASELIGWLMHPDRDNLSPIEQVEASVYFQPYLIYPSGISDWAVGIGDFNHDGLNDVAISDSSSFSGGNKLRIFLQNTSGTLDTPFVYNTGPRPDTLAVGDLNNDQWDDVVVGNFSDDTIGVFLQESDGTLAQQVTYSTNTNPDAVAVADLNNDGLNDVVVSHWNAANIGIFLQQPNGTLGNMSSYSAPEAGYDDIDTGDLNNDGLMDVVKMNGQGLNPNLSVYLQSACGTLDGPISYDLPGSNLSRGVATGDLNDDGLVDIALSHGGNRPNSKVSVFTQIISGILQLDATYDAYDIPESAEIADANMDGLWDVIVAHGGWNRVGTFLQQSDGTLAPYVLDTIPYASYYSPQGMDVGDINNDQLPDIVIADYNNGLVVLYHVSGSSYPTPTPIPVFTPIPCATSSPPPTTTSTSTPTPTTTTTPTVTFTPTSSATSTSTPSATSSPTSTPTSTGSLTPTSSATHTRTPTATFTPTPSMTVTPTPTATPSCMPLEGPILYWNDFELGAGDEWSNHPLDTSPTGRKFLGQFNNGGTKLTIPCLPAHETIRVSFDLFLIRSWDGNNTTSGELTVGPDLWNFGASNNTILLTTFSNWSWGYQAYPLAYPDGNHLAFTGALEINTLGYQYSGTPKDAVYHITFLIPHQANLLELDFSALGLQAIPDESWGLDNVEVMIVDFSKKIYLPMVIH